MTNNENNTKTIAVTKSHNLKSKQIQPIKIIDFDMPFGSMVSFLIKCALASIPAMMILFVIGLAVSLALFSIFGSIMISLFNYG